MKTGREKRVALLVATLAVVVLGVATWLSWPHVQFWWLFEPLGKNAESLPEYRHRQTGIVMVRVPGGTFWMGAQSEDPKGQNYDPDAEPDEGPVHEVTLNPFLIAKCEITQAQWRCVMGPDQTVSILDDGAPAQPLSAGDASEFCGILGLKLPTKAQWQFANETTSAHADAHLGTEDPVGTRPTGTGSWRFVIQGLRPCYYPLP